MRFLIAGLGSVGRRHLRNLVALGERDIVLLRSHRSTLPEDELEGFPVETDLEAALARNPQAVIVANPTALHLEVAVPAASAGCHLLIEKPVSHSLEGVDVLRAEAARSGSRILIGFQFRFHPLLRRIRGMVTSGGIGQVRWAQAHYAEYLPDWHPWEDFRRSYSARADLGGGVLLTLSHPFDYLDWVLGPLECEAARVVRIGGFPIDVEDCANVWLTGPSGVLASVQLDYYRRPAEQWMSVTGDGGYLQLDFLAGRLEGWSGSRPVFVDERVPDGWERNDMFLEEMRHFVRVCRGEEAPSCGIEDGVRALRLAIAARQRAAPAAADGRGSGG